MIFTFTNWNYPNIILCYISKWAFEEIVDIFFTNINASYGKININYNKFMSFYESWIFAYVSHTDPSIFRMREIGDVSFHKLLQKQKVKVLNKNEKKKNYSTIPQI